jgi:hypothetical protein
MFLAGSLADARPHAVDEFTALVFHMPSNAIFSLRFRA